MIPIAGSSYSYAYATLGEFAAWFIGWNMVLEYGVSASAVAVSWTGYFVSLLDHVGVHLPKALTSAPLAYTDGHLVTTGALINLPAVAIVLALTWICYIGIRESSAVNSAMVALKVGLIIVVIVAGWNYVNPDYWHPFIPENQGPEKYGWSGIIRGRGARVLRLHRVRGDLDRGPGGEEPAARPAVRHARLARDLHRALHRHGHDADGPAALHRARHQRAGGDRGAGAPRARLAALGGGGRRAGRAVVRDPGDGHRTARASS
jgi:hypothetical protein